MEPWSIQHIYTLIMSEPNAVVTNDNKANAVLVPEKKSRFKVKNIISEEDDSKIGCLNNFSDNRVVQSTIFSDAVKTPIEEKIVPSSEGGRGYTIAKATLPGDHAPTPVPPKKSRFIVKTVPKDEDRDIESEMDPSSKVQTGVTKTATEIQRSLNVDRAIDMQSQMMQKLEQLLLLNTQMLKTMMVVDKDNGKASSAADAVTTTSMSSSLLASLHDMPASSASTVAPASSSSSAPIINNSLSIPAAGMCLASAVEETSQTHHNHTPTYAHAHHSHTGQWTTADPAPSIAFHTPSHFPLSIPPHPSIHGVLSSAISTASSVSSSSPGAGGEKDKNFAKLTHYLSEMKKELEAAAKQRRSQQLEMQRVSERCRQLEDSLTAEQTKNALLEERLEKAKANQKILKQQLQDLQQAQKLIASSSFVNVPVSFSSELPVLSLSQAPAHPATPTSASSLSAPAPPVFVSTAYADIATGSQTTTAATSAVVVVTSAAASHAPLPSTGAGGTNTWTGHV